jgi:L-asparaginase/Glu-tRNA(Gln) amidotransferase subunit D
MKQKFHYATITEAIEQLKSQGFNLELSLENDHFKADGNAYAADEFEIVDLYRYEGASDPADEATVYALASKSGLKGILVTGYGATNNDEQAEETIKHLHYKYQQGQQG